MIVKALMPGPEQIINRRVIILDFSSSLNSLLARCLPPSFYLIELILNTTVRLFCPKHCFVIALSRIDVGFLFSNA